MARNVQCTITISEIDGKLDIIATIPDGDEKTIAVELAKALINGASQIMNLTLNENVSIKRVITQ